MEQGKQQPTSSAEFNIVVQQQPSTESPLSGSELEDYLKASSASKAVGVGAFIFNRPKNDKL